MLAVSVGQARDANKGASDREKLIGVWASVKSTELPPGSTLEMTKDGKCKLVAPIPNKPDEKPNTYLGTWVVEGTNLKVGMTGADGREQKQTLKILELSATKLVTKDEKNKVDEFNKVDPKTPK